MGSGIVTGIRFVFCFVESRVVEHVVGGMPGIIKKVIDKFFPEDPNMFNFERTGVNYTVNGTWVFV